MNWAQLIAALAACGGLRSGPAVDAAMREAAAPERDFRQLIDVVRAAISEQINNGRLPEQRRYVSLSAIGPKDLVLRKGSTAGTATLGNAANRTAQQLAAEVLTINGLSMGWDIESGLTDWFVPGGAWTYRGNYISAINDIASGVGGYPAGHPVLLPGQEQLRRQDRQADVWHLGNRSPSVEPAADRGRPERGASAPRSGVHREQALRPGHPAFRKARHLLLRRPAVLGLREGLWLGVVQQGGLRAAGGPYGGREGQLILSLNDTPGVREVFANFHIEAVKTRYSISSTDTKEAAEVLISNFKPL